MGCGISGWRGGGVDWTGKITGYPGALNCFSPGGQAKDAGVRCGWSILSIAGVPYNASGYRPAGKRSWTDRGSPSASQTQLEKLFDMEKYPETAKAAFVVVFNMSTLQAMKDAQAPAEGTLAPPTMHRQTTIAPTIAPTSNAFVLIAGACALLLVLLCIAVMMCGCFGSKDNKHAEAESSEGSESELE